MSDFLQFVDRIPTLPNRKKLTFENDGSVKYAQVEYADEPVEEGTFLNKANFNIINSILGYNASSVSQTSIVEPTPSSQKTIYCNTIYPHFSSQGDNLGTVINGELDTIPDARGEFTPTYIIENNKNLPFSADNYYSDSSISLCALNISVGSGKYTSEDWIETLKNAGTLTDTFFMHKNHNLTISFIFDFKNTLIKDADLSFRSGSSYPPLGNLQIYKSDDNINWQQITISDFNPNFEFNTRYLKISGRNDSGYNRYFSINHIKFNVHYYGEKYCNNFIADFNNTFANNQRLLIETPNEVPFDNVVLNTINNINCDKILVSNTKYKLIYNEFSNKFEIEDPKILFDITLTNSVNQIDLTGISDMLKEEKMYSIIIKGTISSSSAIKFGSNAIGYLETNGRRIVEAIFVPNTFDNEKILFANWPSNSSLNSSPLFNYTTITNNEYIKCSTTSVQFNAGTRIIIKEVV